MLHGIDELIGNFLDAPLQPFDHGWRECLMNQCAEAGVVGLVEIEHIAFQRLRKVRQPGLLRSVQPALGKTTVFENRDYIVVAGDEPGLANAGHDWNRDATNRLFRAQAGIKGKRIGFELTAANPGRQTRHTCGLFPPRVDRILLG